MLGLKICFFAVREVQADIRARRGPGGQPVSYRTVNRRIHAAGLKSRKAALKPYLTAVHKALRLAWGRNKI